MDSGGAGHARRDVRWWGKGQAGSIIAALQAIGVTGKSGQVNGSDPFFFYDFQITLEPTFQWENGDYFS